MMENTRMYVFNVYKKEELLGSVRAESTSAALLAIMAYVPPGAYTVARVTAKEAAAPLEKKAEETVKLTKENEKPLVDEAKDPQDDPKQKSKLHPTEDQLQAYANLKQDLAKWDNAQRDSIKTKYTLSDTGLMLVKTMVTTKEGNTRKRELIIGKGGGVRAYGKKPRGTEKLMVALADVIKFCFTETTL